jgi:hypothetical protein
MDTAFPIIFTLLVMLGFGVGSGMLADRKGYNFVLFAIIGLFLGIIGLLIAAVLPKKKPAYSEL